MSPYRGADAVEHERGADSAGAHAQILVVVAHARSEEVTQAHLLRTDEPARAAYLQAAAPLPRQWW